MSTSMLMQNAAAAAACALDDDLELAEAELAQRLFGVTAEEAQATTTSLSTNHTMECLGEMMSGNFTNSAMMLQAQEAHYQEQQYQEYQQLQQQQQQYEQEQYQQEYQQYREREACEDNDETELQFIQYQYHQQQKQQQEQEQQQQREQQQSNYQYEQHSYEQHSYEEPHQISSTSFSYNHSCNEMHHQHSSFCVSGDSSRSHDDECFVTPVPVRRPSAGGGLGYLSNSHLHNMELVAMKSLSITASPQSSHATIPFDRDELEESVMMAMRQQRKLGDEQQLRRYSLDGALNLNGNMPGQQQQQQQGLDLSVELKAMQELQRQSLGGLFQTPISPMSTATAPQPTSGAPATDSTSATMPRQKRRSFSLGC
uniref:Uncharacterized protein n=1 Tax=Craspedostauros australis TaxID=1486917 RepID=A0A7S0F6X9_9STRA